MAKSISIHSQDDLDKIIKEVVEEHQKKIDSVKDLAQGKTVVVNPKLKYDLVADRVCGKIIQLPLREVLLFSGAARIATATENNELKR